MRFYSQPRPAPGRPVRAWAKWLLGLCLVLWGSVLPGYGQTPDITRVEYFLDTDPGAGLATALTLPTPASDLSATGAVPLSSLTTGFHIVGIRSRDSNNKWSLTTRRAFYYTTTAVTAQPNVDKIEYFFDTDPGFGNGVNVPVTASADISGQAVTASLASLTTGFHQLSIRSRDSNGKWSLVTARNFYYTTTYVSTLPNVNKIEYFFDTDPGFGNGVNIPVTASADISGQTAVVDISSLATGFHQLSIRSRDSNGKWSLVTARNFYYTTTFVSTLPNVNKLEYFFDTDPGFGNGVNVPVTASTDISGQSVVVDISSLAVGFHQLSIRSRDSNGKWSLVTARNFYYTTTFVSALPNVNRIEYFFDTDPGFGSGVSIPLTASTDIVNPGVAVDISGLTVGFHQLSIRSRDSNGKWSLVTARNFYYTTTYVSALPNVNKIEYFFDTDPGFGNGVNIPVTAGADLASQGVNVDLTSLTPGFHLVSIRSRDANNKWSLVTARGFYYTPVYSPTTPNITRIEYYFDNDPGFGSGITVPITTPATDLPNVNHAANAAALADGNHRIFIRSRDANGQWSLVTSLVFVKNGCASSSNLGAGLAASSYTSSNTSNSASLAFNTDPAPTTPSTGNSPYVYNNGYLQLDLGAAQTVSSIGATLTTVVNTNVTLLWQTASAVGGPYTTVDTYTAAFTANTSVNLLRTLAIPATGVRAVRLVLQNTSGSYVLVSGAGIYRFNCLTSPVLTSIDPTSGPVGSTVTLNGTDLTGTSAITFAGSSGNIVTTGFTVNATGTQITGIVVPSGAITGNVTVTAGGNGSNGVAFTVTAPQLAVTQGSTSYPSNGTAYSFGNQLVGAGSLAVAFTLNNPGTAPLTISGITTTGNYATSGAIPTTVATGGNATVSVVFTPTTTGTRTGTLVITSSLGTYTVNLTGTGTVLAPVVSSFTPASGPVGTSVTITGTSLLNATSVTVNGTAGTITANTATSLTFTVGAGTTTGLISVTTAGGTGTSSSAFTIIQPPTLTSLTPTSGAIGSTLTLNGTNLTNASTITFVASGLTVTTGFTVNAGGTQITGVVVPSGATTGTVRVTTPGGISNALTFTVIPAPIISAFTPVSGPTGTTVTVTGLNLGAATAVRVNGTAGTITGNGTTVLTFTVGAGSTTGPISVTTAGGTATSSGTFTVIPPPMLSSISPTNGPVGTTVTLNGTNLTGTTRVTFSGSASNIVTTGFVVNAAGTQITGVVVPSGAQTGLVTVTTPGGTANISFTVTTAACASTSYSRLYVNRSIALAGDGGSWATAYSNLGEALYQAQVCANVTEIWVAAGTYVPNRDPFGNGTPTNARDKTFVIKSGLKLYGGFAGTETSPTQRTAANVTTLTGDVNNNDIQTGSGSTLSISNNTDNLYHVVLALGCDATTVLDGLTIRGGYASTSSSLTVGGLSLSRIAGAGLYLAAGSVPTLTNCIIRSNSAAGSGAGMYCAASAPVLTNCTVTLNISNAPGGGGMYNTGSTPVLTDCTFSGNYTFGGSNGGGGAMSNVAFSAPLLTRCTFTNNAAGATSGGGGAVYNSSSSPDFVNCTFSNNSGNLSSSGGNGGGGAIASLNSDLLLSNCVFNANNATNAYGSGGALHNNASAATLTNCTFSGNFSSIYGGAIYNSAATSTLTSCTFSNNSTGTNGGALYYDATAGGTVTNSILWVNTTTNTTDTNREEIYKVNPTPNLDLRYSTVRDYNASATFNIASAISITTANPLFVNAADPDGADNIFRTADDGLDLQTSSPAIDAGDPAITSPATDITGAPRVGVFDQGAYEGASQSVQPVLTSISPSIGTTGSTLTLNGSGLTGTTVIAFTGSSSNTVVTGYTVNAAGTQITGIVVPGGATTGLVTVTNGSGTSNGVTFTLAAPVLVVRNYGLVLPNGATFAYSAQAMYTNNGTATFSLTNEGTAPLTIASITTTGDYALDLVQNGPLPTSIAVGTPGVVSVAFTPTALGPRPGTLVIVTNLGTYTLNFTGTGLPATPNITNIGPSSGQVGTMVSISGSGLNGATSVSFNGTIQTTIGTIPGGVLTVLVPAGATTGPVTVTTPYGTSNGVTFTVLAPQLAVTQSGTSYFNNGLAYSFGSQVMNTSGPAVAFTLTNAGTIPLTISGITATGDFATSGAIPGSVAAGSTSTVSVAFTPTATGTRTGTLVITSSLGTYTVNLTGNGQVAAPTIASFSPTSGPVGTSVTITGTNLSGATSVSVNGTTGTITANTGTAITFTVATGSTTGLVSVTTAGGTASSTGSFTVIPTPLLTSISPASGVLGSSVTLNGTGLTGTTLISFAGTSSNTVSTGFVVNAAGTQITGITVPNGTVTGNVTVTAPGGNSNGLTFSVTAPQLAVSQSGTAYPSNGAAYGFGSQVVNTTSAAVSFTLTNAGTAALSLSGVTTTGNFALSGAAPTSIAAGSTATVSVAFTPTATGTRNGTLVINSTLGTYTVNLTGTGIVLTPSISSFTPASGPAGTSVVVSGANLTGTTALSLNGTAVTGFVVNAGGTTVTFTVPTGATSGFISLTTPGGSATSATAYTVTVPQLAVMQGATAYPSNGPAYNFGNQIISTTSLPTTFTLTNGGATALALTGVSTTGSFALSGAAPTTVPAGGTATLALTFTPTALGSQSGTIRLTSVLGTYVVNLTGAGVPSAPTVASLSPTSGPVGTVVTVTGSNFPTTGTSVTLNGVTVPGTVGNGGTTLTFTVPAGATAGPVVVTTPGGSVTSPSPFCVQYLASGTPASRCGAGSVTLMASGAPTGGSYAWYTQANGGTAIAGAASASYATPSLSATLTYYVAIGTGSGSTACEGPRTAVTATINAIPTVSIAANGPTSFCQGGSVTLTASGADSYLWSTGATTASITVSTAGSFSVTGTSATGSCTASASVPVVVNALPTVTVQAGGPTTFCQGGSVTLTASGATTYLWSTGETTASITVTANGSYSVTGRNAASCPATSAATAVTVTPLPTVSVTANGPTTFCQGGSVTLTASGATSYVWSNGATTASITVSTSGSYSVTGTSAASCSATSTATAVTVTPAPAAPLTMAASRCGAGAVTLGASGAPTGGRYAWYLQPTGGTAIVVAAAASYTTPNLSASTTYYVSALTASGCESARTAVTATINDLPTVSITANGPTSFCTGSSVTLTASGATSYLWSNGATTASITVSTSGAYSVTGTVAGCPATSAATSVTVNPLPVVAVTANGPTSFCAGGSVTLTASGATSYLWSNGQTTASITVSSSGNYSVTGTTTDCSATSAATSVTVNPLPAVSIAANGPTTFCAGSNVTLTASGAASYLWSNGATTASITVSTSGAYSVTGSSAGCSATSAATSVTVNPLPVVAVTANGPTSFCAGGSVTLTASGADSYLWSNGATTASITASTSGNYSVTGTTAGCSATSAATGVTVTPLPGAPLTTAASRCGAGALTLSASGAPTGSSYAWYTQATGGTAIAGATSASFSIANLTATTTYYVSVRTGACESPRTAVTGTINPTPVVSIVANGPTTFCAGGSVVLTASGADSYLWSTGATTASITVSASGSYSATGSSNGCSATSTATSVTVTPLPTVSVTANGPTTFCQGGSVTLTASGATSYVWSNGATTASITVSTSGNYTVTGLGATGCPATSVATSVTVNPLPAVSVSATGPTTFCAGGSVTLIASGASSYLWSTGETTASIIVGTAGNYSVTGTSTAGCPATSATTSVVVNPLPVVSVSANGPTTFCTGGSVTLTASGATSYLWSNGQTTASITVSSSGAYSVTGTTTGCPATSAATSVTVNPLPVVSIAANGPTTFCAGGNVTLTASGADSYLWSTGATTASITVAASGAYSVTGSSAGCSATSAATAVTVNPLPTVSVVANGPTTFCLGGSVTLTASGADSYLWSTGATTASITVSASGSYGVTGSRAGCSATSAATAVVVNSLPTVSVVANGPTTFCAGGSVTLTASGASSYLWNTGETTASITASTSGSYSVTGTNAAGCAATSAATSVTVNPLPVVAVVANGPTSFCLGGSVVLTASGADSYLWSTGETTASITVAASGSFSVTGMTAGCSATSAATTVTVNPLPTVSVTANGPTTFCTGGNVVLTASGASSYRWSTGETTASITVSTDGSYSVVGSTTAGCSATSAATTVTVNPLPVVSVTANGPTTFCAGGSVTLTASGADSYLWSTGATTASITVAASGSYSVLGSSLAGCSASAAATSVMVNPLPAVSVAANGPTTFCAGGSVILTASGADSYLWSTGETTASITASTSGSYSVTGSSLNGCSVTPAAATVTVNPLPVVSVVANGPTSFCLGGSVTLTASGADSYLWSTGETTASITASTSGSYSVVGSSLAGCSTTSAATAVVVNMLPVVNVAANGPTTFCLGGSVTLTASGADSYVWSTGETTASITVSTSGSYTVAGTSAAGCTATAAATSVTVNPLPVVAVAANGPTTFCLGGSVTLTASGADSYLWSTGATTASITVNATGSYSVVGSTTAGCSATSAATTVTVNPLPTVSVTANGPTTFCLGGNVVLTASGADSYRWSTGETTASITVSTDGSYSVIGTSLAGCSATSAATSVTVNPLPVVAVTANGPTSFCAGGSVTLTASGADFYLWNTGETTASITVAATGSYTVTSTSLNGCSTTSAGTVVTVNPLPVVAVTAAGPTTFCLGGSVTLTASGADSYLWSTGETTASITASATGSYSVVGTSLAGCTATSAATSVTVDPLPAVSVTANGPTTFCLGGSVTLTASGADSYLWSTGETTASITVSTSGSYTVAGTSAAGCTATAAVTTVTVNPLPVVAVAANGPTTFCLGGSVTLTASGADFYLWSTGATTASITVAASGSYTVVGSNATGCSMTSAATSVVVNPLPTVSVTAAGPTTFCLGGNVVLTASGADSYRWSTGETTASIAVSTDGSYSVIGTSLAGCSATSAATSVTVNPLPVVAVTANGPTSFCTGGNVVLTASGADFYLWSTGETTASITASTSGSYSVTGSSLNGCSATSAGTVVTVNPLPTVSVMANGPTSFCQGGSVTLTASGADSYLWSTGETTASITVAAAGSFSVVGTSLMGCSATSAATTITVNPLPTASITASGPTTFCLGGSVTLTASPADSYLWSTGETTASIAVSASGSYSVTNTTTDGCSATSATTSVVVNPLPIVSVTANGPTTFCTGGSVTLTASGADSYLWSSGETTASITVAASGSYSVVGTSLAGCTATSATTPVTVSPLPTVSVTADGPTTFCAGGSVMLTASGADSYLWSTGETTASITASATGSYSVVGTTLTGCSATSAVTAVVVNPLPTASITTGGPTTFCLGGNVTLTATGGDTYLWSTGETTASITASATGSYSVVATTAAGCSATSAAISVTATPLPTVSITADGPITLCPGGTVTLTASGADSYLWSSGETTASITVAASGSFSVTGTNATTGCSATSAPTAVIVNTLLVVDVTASGPMTFCQGDSLTLTASGADTYLWSNGATTASITVHTAGSYSVVGNILAGCTATSAVTTVTVNPLPTLSLTASGPTAFCAGGSVTLTATGGDSYLWSSGETTASITVSTSGSYTVTASNATGCSVTSAATVVDVQDLPVATATPASRCNTGTLTLTASGAPATGSYAWYTQATGGTAISGATSDTYLTPSLTATTTYYVSALSSLGCEGPRTAVVATVNAMPTATITAAGPTTFCDGGSVTLTATGGDTYLWSNGATTASITVSASGSYTVTASTTAGCSVTSAATSVTAEPLPAQPVITQSPAGTLTSSSPTGNQWYLGPNLIPGATGQTYVVASAAGNGSYTVVVTSATGCVSPTSASEVVLITATATSALAGEVKVFPNPAHHTCTVQVPALAGATSVKMVLYDVIGQEVLQRTLALPTTGARTELDVRDLATGVYLLRLHVGPYLLTKRLVIE